MSFPFPARRVMPTSEPAPPPNPDGFSSSRRPCLGKRECQNSGGLVSRMQAAFTPRFDFSGVEIMTAGGNVMQQKIVF